MDGWGWQVWTSFFIVGATQDCGFGVSCLFIYFLLDTTMMAFHLWSFQLSILKSVIIVFFAGLTDSTSQFDKAVLSKCVTHVGFVDDMSPSGNTFLGRNWETWSGSEFTIFNLVIRLSEVEQLAFFHFSPCRLSLLEQLAAVPGFAFFRFSPCRLSLSWQHVDDLKQVHAFRYGDFFFLWLLVRFKCAPNSAWHYWQRQQGWVDYRGPQALSLLLHAIVDASFSLTT